MSKQSVFASIDQNEAELKNMASTIWEYAETAMKEFRSSKLQKEYLADQGFTIKEIPNNPTSFIAEFGSGKPIIGILGEYDALPTMSQKIQATRERYGSCEDGHGCGHNLLGTAGVGAVTALKKAMTDEGLKGTIRYYGCAAEETLSGKVLMAKEGVFDDLDICISWHPASMNVVWGCSFLALNSMKFRFTGTPAHAAAAPQAGRSALDGVELMNVGANYLREHVIEKARIHYTITRGGGAPNTVPADAEVWYFVRAPKRDQVREITERLIKIANGAAMMTETSVKMELLAGCYDVIASQTLGKLLHDNMVEVGPPKFTEEDFAFGKELASATTRDAKKGVMVTYFAPDRILDKVLCDEIVSVDDSQAVMAGSVDAGDVSYICPFAQITAATWPVGTPAHSWIATASSGSGIGLNAMIFSAKTMAGAVYDMLVDNSLVESARAEFKKSIGDFKYISPYEE